MRDDPTVVELVRRARSGEQAAWDELVERYASLVWSICRRHGLSGPDCDDVGAAVWLRLVENLATIREPAALPGWIATTTRFECLDLLRRHKRVVPVDGSQLPDTEGPASDEWLLDQERHVALRQAFEQLSQACRQLLSMLFADPPASYAQISTALGMPVGSIGPSRQRCLKSLRSVPAIAALLDSPDPTGVKG